MLRIILLSPQGTFDSIFGPLDVLQLSGLPRLAEFGHRIVRIGLILGHQPLVQTSTALGLVSGERKSFEKQARSFQYSPVVILIALQSTVQSHGGVSPINCFLYHSFVGGLCYF